MKIGKLEMHCGECSIIDHCDGPFSDIAVCCDKRLKEVEEDEFLKLIENTKGKTKEMRIEAAVKTLEKSCFDCMFYDYKNICCMYDCAVKCILDEEDSARNCSHYKEGEYDPVKLEETNYKGVKRKRFKVPVSWEMCGMIEVVAETKEEALEIVRLSEDDFPLPPDAYYVDDSFELSSDNDEELKAMMEEV